MTELGQHRIFPDFKRQRARMVKLLEEQGITDEAVLAAMRTVRRHLFVPEALQGRAYEDHALPIGFGQTISQPYIVAFMSQLLEAKPGMKVLEIGTGSGYQAAVLREMGLEVFTIERVRELYEAVRELFPEGSPGIRMKLSDGTLGWRVQAPFDRIIVTAGGPNLPLPLLEQLADPGIMAIPVGRARREQKLLRVSKREGRVTARAFGNVAFVDLVGDHGWEGFFSLPFVANREGPFRGLTLFRSLFMSSCSNQAPQGQATLPMTAAMQNKVLTQNLKDVRHKLFVMSGKGGVGKSSVTVNLATALASRGFTVGILDVDIHGPSVPRLLGASASVMADENGKMLPVPCGERMSLISMDSFLKDKDTAILWRGPKKTGAIRQFLTDVQWGALDYLVIDSPPGTGDEHLTVLDAIPDAGCIVVTTPQEISLADVRKALDFLKQVQAPVLGIVENMSGLSCPHCGKEIDLFKKGGGEQLAKQYELPFLGAIPLDPATVIAADRGVPVVSLTENSPARQGVMALADAVIAATEAE